MQNHTNPDYTLSASGNSAEAGQVVLAKQLSQIQRPDAPNQCEISGLADGSNVALTSLDTLEVAITAPATAAAPGQLSSCTTPIQTFAGKKNDTALAVATATDDNTRQTNQIKLQIITSIEQSVSSSIDGYAQTILGELSSAQALAQSNMPASSTGNISVADLNKTLTNIQQILIKPTNPPNCASLSSPIP